MPMKTFTELLPVMLPMEASAYCSHLAAVIDAKVSGSDVPKATNVIAVTSAGRPRQQPTMFAKSPTMAVTTAMAALS